MNPLYAQVATRAAWRCEYCQAPEEVFNCPFEVEHVVPRARGGTSTLDNLALACHACNRFKSDATSGHDEITGQQVSLFKPRTDAWTAHFRFDAEEARIVGLTATGRVTVARLQVNRPPHVRARQRWIQLGLFP